PNAQFQADIKWCRFFKFSGFVNILISFVIVITRLVSFYTIANTESQWWMIIDDEPGKVITFDTPRRGLANKSNASDGCFAGIFRIVPGLNFLFKTYSRAL